VCSIISVTGTALEFIVHGYADVYDEEAFLKYVNNHSGYFYSKLHPSISKPQMEQLYKAIFEKRTLKLRICAAYTADFRTGLRPLARYIYPRRKQHIFAIRIFKTAAVSARMQGGFRNIWSGRIMSEQFLRQRLPPVISISLILPLFRGFQGICREQA